MRVETCAPAAKLQSERCVIHVLKIIINNSNIRIKRAIVTDEPKRMKAK